MEGKIVGAVDPVREAVIQLRRIHQELELEAGDTSAPLPRLNAAIEALDSWEPGAMQEQSVGLALTPEEADTLVSILSLENLMDDDEDRDYLSIAEKLDEARRDYARRVIRR